MNNDNAINVEHKVHDQVLQSFKQDLDLQQCSKGYFRLPVVPKHLYRGPRNGLYYVNQNGKKVFINKHQKKRIQRDHALPGVLNPTGLNPLFNPALVPESVFQRADQQLEYARQM